MNTGRNIRKPSKTLLLAALGTTPAILTEAFYYFVRIHQPPIVFSEVHALVTTEARRAALQHLLGSGRRAPGAFDWLIKHLGIPGRRVTFGEKLYARPQDRLFHVLVDPRLARHLDRLRKFFEVLLRAQGGREQDFAARLDRDFAPAGDYTVGLSIILAKIRRKVARVVPASLVSRYAITKLQEYGRPEYALGVDGSQIDFVNPVS